MKRIELAWVTYEWENGGKLQRESHKVCTNCIDYLRPSCTILTEELPEEPIKGICAVCEYDTEAGK